MSPSFLLVKNMVCHRCVTAVEDILVKASIGYHQVIMSQVVLESPLPPEQKTLLSGHFKAMGFELVTDRSSTLIEQIKQLVNARARNEHRDNDNKLKLSGYLSGKVNYEYTYLSSLFSVIEGKTIEKYYLQQRIEKVKELLVYGEHTVSQVALDLDYSSVAHLSAQFKRITGLTPSFFKKMAVLKPKIM